MVSVIFLLNEWVKRMSKLKPDAATGSVFSYLFGNKHAISRGIILFTNTGTIWVIFFYNWTQCIDGFSLYYKDMLEKVTAQRTQQFSAFVCYQKNRVKCNACTVAQTIETNCFCRNLPISNDPVVRISRNLDKNSSEATWMIYHEKSEFWHREFLIRQKAVYGDLRKSALSKF